MYLQTPRSGLRKHTECMLISQPTFLGPASYRSNPILSSIDFASREVSNFSSALVLSVESRSLLATVLSFWYRPALRPPPRPPRIGPPRYSRLKRAIVD